MRGALIGPTAVIRLEQITYIDTRIPTGIECSRVPTGCPIALKERVSNCLCKWAGLIGEPDAVWLTGRRHSHDEYIED